MELQPFAPNVMAIIAMGVGLAVGAWFLTGLHAVRSRKDEKQLPEAELPGHAHEVSGVPPAVTAFLIFVAASLIVYVLYVWLMGVSY